MPWDSDLDSECGGGWSDLSESPHKRGVEGASASNAEVVEEGPLEAPPAAPEVVAASAGDCPRRMRLSPSRSRSRSPSASLSAEKRKTKTRRFLTKTLSACSATESRPSGTEWWSSCMMDSVVDLRDSLPPESRPLVVESPCAGTWCEGFLAKALDIPISKCAILSEKNPAAQRFILKNWQNRIGHLFGSMEEHALGAGKCHMPGHTTCCIQGKPRCDIALIGPPYQPFSELRNTKGSSKKTAAAESHPDFCTLATGVPDFLSLRRPLIAIVEEVLGIAKKAKDGSSVLQQLVDELLETFQGVEVVTLNAADWSDVSRQRIFIGCFSEEVGGAAAADEWVGAVEQIVNFRKIWKPQTVFYDIISEQEAQQMIRLGVGSVQAAVDQIESAGKKGKEYARWKSHCARLRSTLGVGPTYRPWTSRPETKLHGVPRHCDRLMEMLDLCYIDVQIRNTALPKDQQRAEHDVTKGLTLDLSQAAQRKPWGYGIRTLHKNTMLYCYQIDAVLNPQMLFRLHGFPNECIMEGSAAQLTALVGDSWSLPCAGAAFYAAYLSRKAPWWSLPTNTREQGHGQGAGQQPVANT